MKVRQRIAEPVVSAGRPWWLAHTDWVIHLEVPLGLCLNQRSRLVTDTGSDAPADDGDNSSYAGCDGISSSSSTIRFLHSLLSGASRTNMFTFGM